MRTTTDEELAALAAGGDAAVLDSLVERYFAALYDFALRLSRSRDVAALAVQESFLAACASGDEDGTSFEMRLFAETHYYLARRLRARASSSDEPFATGDAAQFDDPALAGELPELASLAWQAAEELRLDDYELLDLSLRHGWRTNAIAAALRMREESITQRLARADAALEEGFTARLLAGRRWACVDLDLQLGDGEWSPALRRSILRHLSRCDQCQTTRNRYPPARRALAALAVLPAPAGWQETIRARLQDAARSGVMRDDPSAVPAAAVGAAAALSAERGAQAATTARANRSGDSARPIPPFVLFAGGVLVIASVLGGMCASGAFGGGGTSGASATPTATVTATATATSTLAPTSTPPPPPTPTPVPTRKKKRGNNSDETRSIPLPIQEAVRSM